MYIVLTLIGRFVCYKVILNVTMRVNKFGFMTDSAHRP